MSEPASLQIEIRGSFGHTTRIGFLFANRELATETFDALVVAAKAYQNRANDRERLFTFTSLSGPGCVDVSELAAFGVEDPLGDNRELLERWHIGNAQITATGTAAANAIIAGTTSDGAPVN